MTDLNPPSRQSNARLCVLQDLLAPPLVSASYEIFRHYQLPTSNTFLPVDAIQSDAQAARALGSRMDAPLAHLISRYCNRLVETASELFPGSLAGFEVWTSVAQHHNEKVLLHVDNDEGLRRRTGEVRCPLFGSILYLGPKLGLRGGGTFLALSAPDEFERCEILFQPTPWQSVPISLRDKGVVIPFKVGRTVIFDGEHPHCTMPFEAEAAPRVCLLVNGWDKNIELVRR